MSGPLIVFDGVCVLCTAWLRFVLKHDRRAKFRFSTAQSPAGQKLLRNHGLDPSDPTSFLVIVGDKSYNESGGMIEVVSGFGGAWRMIRLLYVVPGPIRDWFYRLIARHRYRLFGKRESCFVPDRETSDRFVANLDDLKELDLI